MPSIEEIKAGLAGAADDSRKVAIQARAVAENAERAMTNLQGIARGSDHAKIREAVGLMQQARQKALEAAAAAESCARSSLDYITILG